MTFANDRLLKAAGLAQQLNAWKVGLNQNGKSDSKTAGNIIDEFGSNLDFQVPSASSEDFDDDTDDEDDDDTWEDIEPEEIPSAASHASDVFEQNDGQFYESNKEEWQSPRNDGVGGVTLRWFYKACEQRSGQFSGSDLAMALYHVLDTERFGDEVRLAVRILDHIYGKRQEFYFLHNGITPLLLAVLLLPEWPRSIIPVELESLCYRRFVC